MSNTIDIPANIKRFRKLKNLSQKQVALAIDVAQAQYSIIESGKTIPTIPTLEKIAKVFEVDITDLIKNPSIEQGNINLSILEKIKLIDTLDKDEKDALFKMIDIAISKKKLKDNLANLMEA
jgi:transcriptional regulator with XRE-family HTH domain